MPNYSNPPAGGPGAITVSVTYIPGPMGQHRIQYVGLAGAGAYQGFLDYTFSATALEIHTMSALPNGSGLGTLLLYEAANRAAFHGVNRIEALNVAATARGFYLQAGFHPSRADRDNIEAAFPTPGAGANFGIRVHLARNIGVWDAPRTHVLQNAFSGINGRWL
jgi:hypothetical protein